MKKNGADKIIRLLAYNGKISIICANTTELVEKARIIHDLSPLTTAAFRKSANNYSINWCKI